MTGSAYFNQQKKKGKEKKNLTVFVFDESGIKTFQFHFTQEPIPSKFSLLIEYLAVLPIEN